MKTTELSGPALDWAVAKVNKNTQVIIRNGRLGTPGWAGGDYNGHNTWTGYYPSTDWAQGGPIIERELCELVKGQSGSTGPVYWEARAGFEDEPGHAIQYGPTPLIAAMRCFVASKLGDEVDIPEELLPTQLDADKARLAQARRAFDQNPTPPLSTIIRRLAASVARQEKAK